MQMPIQTHSSTNSGSIGLPLITLWTLPVHHLVTVAVTCPFGRPDLGDALVGIYRLVGRKLRPIDLHRMTRSNRSTSVRVSDNKLTYVETEIHRSLRH